MMTTNPLKTAALRPTRSTQSSVCPRHPPSALGFQSDRRPQPFLSVLSSHYIIPAPRPPCDVLWQRPCYRAYTCPPLGWLEFRCLQSKCAASGNGQAFMCADEILSLITMEACNGVIDRLTAGVAAEMGSTAPAVSKSQEIMVSRQGPRHSNIVLDPFRGFFGGGKKEKKKTCLRLCALQSDVGGTKCVAVSNLQGSKFYCSGTQFTFGGTEAECGAKALALQSFLGLASSTLYCMLYAQTGKHRDGILTVWPISHR